MVKRERGEGGLFRMKGSRMWYGQWYQNGKQVRVSLKTDVKEKAKRELRRKMGDAERGAAPENETRKLRYGNLRQALLDDYTREVTNPCKRWRTVRRRSGDCPRWTSSSATAPQIKAR